MTQAQAELLPRAANRSVPVTPWRRELAGLADKIALLIKGHEDPERRDLTAREIAEDIRHGVTLDLSRSYGRVFDPLVDGPQ